MDEDFEQRCQEIKESRKQRGTSFDTEDLKTFLSICNQPCKTQFFALSSLLQGSDCASSYFCVMPKEDSVPGCKKTDPKCNEKLKMPAGPVDASTPCSKGKLCFTQTFLEKVLKSLFL